MKSIVRSIFFLASFSILSCNSPEENPNESITKKMLENYPEMGRPAPPPAPTLSDVMNPLLIGKWKVDSAGFRNNGVREPLSAPLVDSYWEFTKDGQLTFSGNISNTSDITIVNNTFIVKVMGTDLRYKIASLTANDLEIVGEIGNVEKTKMESIAKLKRVK